MFQQHTATADNNSQLTAPLLDRMDPAIGEATTVMGAMVTELIRRSLRGGVMQIGQELQTYVGEQVEATIVERRPMIEQVAIEVADVAARSAATEVAKEEVLEVRQFAHGATEAARTELHGRIEEAEKHATDVTLETARGLTSQIEEAEKRATETARTELTGRLDELVGKSRRAVALLKDRIRTVEGKSVDMGKRLEEQQTALKAELLRSLQEANARLRKDFDELRQTNVALTARVAELEKPGWFRRMLNKLMFWKKN